MSIRDLQNLSKDDILAALGLQSKTTTLDLVVPGVSIFAAGLLVGVGLGLLFAPKSGAELRDDLHDQYRKAMGAARQQIGTLQENAGLRPTSVSGQA